MPTHTNFLALAFITIPAFASADVVFAVDNTTIPGLQGYTTYDKYLNITGGFATNTGVLQGIAAGSQNDVYLTDAHNIYHYDAYGNQLGVAHGLSSDGFGRVSFCNGTLYVADNIGGGLQGVLAFNAGLTSYTSFLTPDPITGLAANGTGVIAVAKTAFTQFANSGANLGGYTGFSADGFGAADQAGNTVFVADNTDYPGLQGVVEADTTTWSYNAFLTADPILGLAAGSSSDLYLSFGNRIQRFDLNGNVLNTWTALSEDGMGDLAYATPEPASMLALGLGMVGLLRRRRSPKG